MRIYRNGQAIELTEAELLKATSPLHKEENNESTLQ